MTPSLCDSLGFTLIELLVSIAVFSIVLAGIVGAFQAQLRSHNTQQRTLDMQQNVRGAAYYMTRELKMAGLDMSGSANAGIAVNADHNTISFSMDFLGGAGDGIDNDDDGLVDEGSDGNDNNGNGLTDEPDEAEWFDGDTDDMGEQVTYTFSNDINNNGQCDGLPTESNDGTPCQIMRNGQLLALNVDALNFVYLGVDPTNAGCENDCRLATPIANPDNVLAVQISIVARSGPQPLVMGYAYTDRDTYRNQQGDIILPQQNDNFRRFLLTTEVRCRNLGFN